MPPIPASASRAIAAAAIACTMATAHEGLKLTPYYDPPGILTVCRGHTGADVTKNKRFTLQECDALLDTDMKKAVKAVETCIPGLPVEVLAAFSDAAYNIGPAVACDTKKSTAARLLKSGNYRAACEQLPRWDKAYVAGVSVALPGLTKRREEERQLCLSGLEVL